MGTRVLCMKTIFQLPARFSRKADSSQLRNIVGESGSEYRAHCIYDLLLLGTSIHISGKQRHNG